MPLFDRRVKGRSLAYLYTLGAALGCLTLVLPHDPAVNEAPLYGLAALAVAIGLVMLRRAEHVTDFELHAAVAIGSLVLAVT
ncbi:MAG: hypothetical protein M3131_02355, partial [Actinomycetota bacterium]|nr:hypothetical protein [Actinomycetota bacterium]